MDGAGWRGGGVSASQGKDRLDTFANARARRVPLDGLAALLGVEPGLARALDAIVALAAREVPPLEAHLVGKPQVTTLSRTVAPTWVARMFLGAVEPAAGLIPALDVAPLLGSGFPSERAKLRCMLAYFERCADELPRGTLRFERIVVPARTLDAWRADRSPLLPLEVLEHGAIEDAHDCRQIDFANRFLGGGVLSGGNVQEEIRFAVAPEHLAAMIVSPMMRHDEAISMHGCETFAATRGYGGTLEYAGPLRDPAPRLADGTPDVEFVAIDAVDYRRGDPALQYQEASVLRELTKARAGFARDAGYPAESVRGISTGNWGCGAFHGDPPHKAVLQWLAASAEGRPVRYYTFRDLRVGDLAGFAQAAIAKLGTVGALVERVLEVRSGGDTLYRQLLA
jgi:poly(ADP-ribose) glycohydrolase